MVYCARNVFLALIICQFVACSEELPDDAGALRALADGIEEEKKAFETVHKTWRSGDVSSTFIAFVDGDDVVLIEEDMKRGESGVAKNRFYFYGDQLFCYREKRTNTDGVVQEFEVLFNREGKVVGQKQLENGKHVEMAAYVVPLAKKHGKTLWDLVNEKGE